MKEINDSGIICGKCNILLESGKIHMSYQKQTMSADLLRCPKCGQAYISEKLVKGKMFEVERALEDK